MFEIDNTPFPAKRLTSTKYDSTFSRLQPGQCIKTHPEAVNRVSNALRKWLKNRGRTDVIVRIVAKMDDGYGRVYLLSVAKPPIRMADLPGRRVVRMGGG